MPVVTRSQAVAVASAAAAAAAAVAASASSVVVKQASPGSRDSRRPHGGHHLERAVPQRCTQTRPDAHHCSTQSCEVEAHSKVEVAVDVRCECGGFPNIEALRGLPMRCIREILQDERDDEDAKPFRMTTSGLHTIQESSEAFMPGLFEDCVAAATHGGRKTVLIRDMRHIFLLRTGVDMRR
mmetsp:Transcript_60432/g.197794  ORF Transcript_60432/g.197794 Transcript_60432/m.197794 type:complete len:182 (+) Transcript_60432:65-610(+)|eukprot:CAMPEP_0203890386 /NCGR_PEP_ID=MMETSP0359-20131031/33811_1 /ASSEMBLY_ACC=CAM_ASM_000338 /TAXON_ID=268821 /ORGANISM="Scrippsiella Hangoei, Strain SHTV-5" /LENGTH=181 /DNA_ID=CAMNT_0050811995 /DNA_START=6 /DNA_END=551 /DNA_ORIENTATION=-